MLKPLNGRILVKPDEKVNKTESGIYLTEVKESPATGTVIEGNEEIKTGDRVLFSKYGFDEYKDGSEVIYVLSPLLVLAKIL